MKIIGEEYKPQARASDATAWYGIGGYTKLQKALHSDIVQLLRSKKYAAIPADECQVVFGRIYAVYCLAEVAREGHVKFVDK